MSSLEFFKNVRGEIRFKESMAKHTSWGVGGPADYWFVPKDKIDLVEFIVTLPREVPLFWIGLGSNLLIRDGGIRGAVVCTHKGLSSIRTKSLNQVEVEAGVTCAKVAKFCARAGLLGSEFFAGIPGTMGGALAMNAGAYGKETWDVVKRAEILDRDGNVDVRDRSDVRIAYRNASIGQEEWFVSAVLELCQGKPNDAQKQIRSVLSNRLNSQPIGSFNAGSVFKNPADDYAARLIDAAGLKGLRIGGASVSLKHANFIINDGGASATDIEELILLVEATVLEKFHVELKKEVKIIGVGS